MLLRGVSLSPRGARWADTPVRMTPHSRPQPTLACQTGSRAHTAPTWSGQFPPAHAASARDGSPVPNPNASVCPIAENKLARIIQRSHFRRHVHIAIEDHDVPALLPASDTPTDKGNTQANLSVYTHAPKTHTNTKQQGHISVRVFYCAYVYRLLYVHEWFVGAFVCVDVWYHVLQGRHREAHTL